MTLKEVYEYFERDADSINDWRVMSKSEIANHYCDYDEIGNLKVRDHYFSALMCKYSYMPNYLYNKYKLLFKDFDVLEYVDWVSEGLLKGLKYRRWRDPNFDVYNLQDGAEKVFNRCIFSIQQWYLKHYNQAKRSITTKIISLESMEEDNDELYNAYKNDWYEDSHEFKVESDEICYTLTKYFIDRNDLIKAFIVDRICYDDSYKDGEFSIKKVVKALNYSLNEDFVNKFKYLYGIDKDITRNLIKEILKIKNQKLYKYVSDTLTIVKNNERLMRLLLS